MDALWHSRPTCGRDRGISGSLANQRGDECASFSEAGDPPLGAIQQWCGVDRSMQQWLSTPEVIEAIHMKGPKGTEKNNLHYVGGCASIDLSTHRHLLVRLART
jgi:hypothetical protein